MITSEFPPQPGGIGQQAHDLAHHLAQRNEVSLLADRRSQKGDEEADFDARQDFKVVRTPRYALIFFTYIRRLVLGLRLSKTADVVLVSGKFSLWQGGFIRLFHKKPILAVIHGTEVLLANSYLKKLTDHCLTRFDHIIAVSHYTLGLVKHLPLKASSVIPNGIRLDRESSPKKNPDKPLQLITVGNLTPRKGQHNVIKALPRLIQSYPQLTYHCVGIPTNKQELQHLTESLSVSEHVQFHGRVSHQEKERLLRESHLFMMLSERTPSGDVEGFGIAILEANQYGVPAIGSKGSGIEDAIKEEFSGKLVDPKDETEVDQAVKTIRNEYPAYSQNSLNWVRRFEWNKVIEEYETIIQRLDIKNQSI